MRLILLLITLAVGGLMASAALPPILRNELTTNGSPITVNRLVARAVTNYAHATTMTVDGSTDVFADITNATSANVSILLTNCVIGKSGTLSLLSDGSARTISIFSGATLTPMSTNDTVNVTNILTTASKRTLWCWSVRRGGATQTNVVWWAKNAP